MFESRTGPSQPCQHNPPPPLHAQASPARPGRACRARVPQGIFFKMTDPANPSDNGPLPGNPPAAAAVARHPGHELPTIVQPSTYLHLRAPTASASATTATATGPSRPLLASAAASTSSAAHQSHSHTTPAPAAQKPLMTPLDRDQVQGLVSKERPWETLLRTEILQSTVLLGPLPPCVP